MTEQLYRYHKMGFKIFSNYGLTFPYTPLTKKILMDMIDNHNVPMNACLAIDEAHIYLDSRTSMGKSNRKLTTMVLQNRKRNMRLLYSTQHFGQVDVRLRRTTDIIVFCKNLTNTTSLISDDKTQKVYVKQETMFQYDNKPPITRVLYANPIYPLYDTSEIVDWEDDEPLPRARGRPRKETNTKE